MLGYAKEAIPAGSSMRPNCCTSPSGDNCHHCAAAWKGVVKRATEEGRKIVCEHQSEPFRYTTFMIRVSSRSTPKFVPSCSPDPKRNGSSGPQSFVGAVKAAAKLSTSDPTCPVIVLICSRLTGAIRGNVWIKLAT